jgi:hypothetical protein
MRRHRCGTEIQPRFRSGDTPPRIDLLELAHSNNEMDLIAHKLSRSPVPKGPRENSPAFQCRVQKPKTISPERDNRILSHNSDVTKHLLSIVPSGTNSIGQT